MSQLHINSICAAVDLNSQRRAELARDRDELNQLLEEIRLKDEEDKRW